MSSDLRTCAIVLRRTNYGESDRILNLLTPEGKIAALAKGVRKEKSRLAGSIELFSVADVVVHKGRTDLGTLTGAKMLRFYGNILSDLTKLELASEFLRKAERTAEQMDNPDYFYLTDQALAGLNSGLDNELVKTWFLLNLAIARGEEINFLRDINGNDLSSDCTYFWDHAESALREDPHGNIGAREIKLARVITTNQLATIARINQVGEVVRPLNAIARAFAT